MPKKRSLGEEKEESSEKRPRTRGSSKKEEHQNLTDDQKDAVDSAREGVEPAISASTELCTKTVALADDKKTLSGFKETPPSGFDRADVSDVKKLADEIGHTFTDGGANDHPNKQGYFKGRYFASHAEKQAAVVAPNKPITVSKPMCADCREFFQALALKKGKDFTVADPEVTRIFRKDGTITEVYEDDSTHQADDPKESTGKKPGVKAIEPCPDELMTKTAKRGVNTSRDRLDEVNDESAKVTTKTVAMTDAVQTASGFKEDPPKGFKRASAENVKQLADSFEHRHEFTNGGASDGKEDSDGYFPGRYFACHAEKQAAVLDPNAPISVSKPMCEDCRKFFRALAKHQKKEQIVADPEKTRVFYPDGFIMELGKDGKKVGEKLPSQNA